MLGSRNVLDIRNIRILLKTRMYGVHSCVPDLHASYEGAFVKIYGKKTISLVTSGTQEVLSTMQGCTLQSVLFLWRREKNQKRHPP